MKRFEMLGHDALSDDFLTFLVAEMENCAVCANVADNPNSKEHSIRHAGDPALLVHLEIKDFDDIDRWLSACLRGAIEYFHSEWWCTDDNWSHCNYLIASSQVDWITALHYGVFSGGMLQDWNAVRSICCRFDRKTAPEYSDSDPVEYFQFWICVATYICEGSCESVTDLYQSVEKCRLKKVRLLKQCLESIMSGDQTEFDRSLREVVRRELPAIRKAPGFDFWVSLDATVLWLIAEHAGLSFPKLNDQCSAAVVRRDTIGLA